MTQTITPQSVTVTQQLERLEAYAEAALIHEAMGKRGALAATIKPAYAGAKVFGRALTVASMSGDNLMYHKALSIAEPGDVLVVATGEYLEAGAWGEIATVAAQHRGVRGLITDGAVRDVDAIQELDFPVFCGGLSIKGTTKRQPGRINEPIVIGNVNVSPGDLVVGDTDGVVVIPSACFEETIAAAEQLRTREAEIMQRIRQGELTIDLLGLRDALQQIGMDV